METTDREVLLAEGVPLALTDGSVVQLKYTGRSVAHLEQQFGSIMAMQRLFFAGDDGLQCDGQYDGRQLRHAPPRPSAELAATAVAFGAELEAAEAPDDKALVETIREKIADLEEENAWHAGDECPKCKRNQRMTKSGDVPVFQFADSGPKFEPLTRMVACGVEADPRFKGKSTAQVADELLELLDVSDQLTTRYLAMQALSVTFGIRKPVATGSTEEAEDTTDPTAGTTTPTTEPATSSPGDSSGTPPSLPLESVPANSGS